MLQIFTKSATLLCVAMCSVSIAAADQDTLGGTIEAVTPDGQSFQLPLVSSHITATIEGDIASVSIRQVFENPSTGPVNAAYLFPLNEDAAVHAMTMTVGDETIRAQIKHTGEARETFETAKRQGQSAALLSQHRPNMFNQEVVNLMPEQPVTVELTYAQIVPFRDDAYELVIPTVVGPRYMPASRPAQSNEDLTLVDQPSDAELISSPSGRWVLAPPPEYPDVAGLTVPDSIEPDRLSFEAKIRGGVDIAAVTSATHGLNVHDVGDTESEKSVSLTTGRTIPNRDLILRYELGGTGIQAGTLTHVDERGGFFSLVITPPELPREEAIAAREIVFVLDTSGSMNGRPLRASKTFMQAALKALRPQDAFRVVQFSSSASEFSSEAVAATPANVRAGRRYVERLRAGGGTKVISALNQAFSVPETPGRVRIVVFLTDGYIGNEIEVLRQQTELMGTARVYAFGIGSSVNRYLLEEMARRGRGLVRYVDPTETSDEAAEALARRIDAPVLTDISLDLGALGAEFVTPNPIPDLFAGEAIRLTGRFDPDRFEDGPRTISVTGFANGREATLPITVSLREDTGASALPVIWARGQIADFMTNLATPERLRTVPLTDQDIEQKVTELGLNFDLVTQWTSFVAVSDKIVNADKPARDAGVALEQPAGVPVTAYPGGQSFGGSSAPEPGFWLMLLLVSLGAGYVTACRYRGVA